MSVRVFLRACALVACAAASAGGQVAQSNARARWEWFYQPRAYPFAQVPSGALERARSQLASSRLAGISAVSGTRWEAIGPTLINANAIGRTSTIALHPVDPNTFYIGGAQGGVWKTTDGGTTWTAQTDRECSLAMGSIAIDPVNPEIVYAATGEQHFSGDSYYGCGVLRSTNGGASWTRLGATVFVRSRIARILIVPGTAGSPATTTLLAASDNGLWRSPDGGATWTQLRTGIATDIVLDPTNPQVVYAAIRQQGVFRSPDGGNSWFALGTGFPTVNVGRINIAISASQPSTLYASVHDIVNSTLLGVYRTTDNATTWTQIPATGASCGTQCWYDMFIAVHPTDPNTLYFGGVSLYRSTDAGQTFGNITGGIHVDQHFFAFDPRDPAIVYVTNDGGVYRSANGGTSWTSLNDGLALTQFYSGIALHPWDPAIVLGGTQDNGTLLYTGVLNWGSVIGGDGGFTAIDFENPLIRYGETQWSSTTGGRGPRRSDGGAFILRRNGINLDDPAQFIPPLVMDATSPRTLYFGTNRVYRTTDAADNWTAISPAFNGTLRAIAPAPTNPSVVYAGTSTGQLMVTFGGETWQLRASGLPQRSITDIAVSYGDPNTAYVTVSGFGTGHVFRTVNAGDTWTDVSGSLPDMPVNAVVLDPANPSFVMLGTDLGVFVSTSGGGSWTVLDDGMPNVAVFDIAYDPATANLIAATHGRGMFRLQLDRALTLAAVPKKRRGNTTQNSVTVLPDSAAVVLSGTGAGTAAWTATHGSATWLTLTTAAGAGSGRVRWTRNPAGLAPGFHVDTITIVAAGAIDSPSRVIDTLYVEPVVPALSVTPAVSGASAPAGSNAAGADSALVTIVGVGAAQLAWTAAPRQGTWLTLTNASGVGPGTVRWTRNASGISVGVHYDTIVVTAPGATGSPAFIADSLTIGPALALATVSRRDTLTSGGQATKSTTVQLTILGDPSGTVAWSVSHGAAPWLVITTPSGRGSAQLSWTKSAFDLPHGVYTDTITVTAPGAEPVRFIETLVVVAPAVTRECVSNHALGAPCLDPTQLRWLDLAGNKDGVYNLGDLLAYLARSAGGREQP